MRAKCHILGMEGRRAGATAQTTQIFNKSATLVFFAVRMPMGDNFRYEYSIYIYEDSAHEK